MTHLRASDPTKGLLMVSTFSSARVGLIETYEHTFV
jgi:hypothetical protein